MKAWITGPASADFATAARLLRGVGYRAQTPEDLPDAAAGDLRAELSWLCGSVIAADVVVALPGYPDHTVELTLAGALRIPVVDLDEALATEPARLSA